MIYTSGVRVHASSSNAFASLVMSSCPWRRETWLAHIGEIKLVVVVRRHGGCDAPGLQLSERPER